MRDLDKELTELGLAIAWPASPNLKVQTEIAIPLADSREGSRWARPLAIAAGVALVAAALLAYTPARDAIADFLNLHTSIQRVPQLQTPSPRPGQPLGLGTPVTLATAQSSVSWHIGVPSALGQPDQVYLALPPIGPSGGEVTLYYGNGPILVTEARGSVNEQFFGKTIGPGTSIEAVAVNGHSGWWVSGQPHGFVFIDPNGNPYFDTLRLAKNTLIFDDNGTIVRIEGDMTKQQALRIAGTV